LNKAGYIYFIYYAEEDHMKQQPLISMIL